MNRLLAQLTDVTIHSHRTRLHGVKAADVELRPWIKDFPVCPALNQYQIVHVGIMQAVAPTRIVRTNQTTTYFLACFGGKGKVLIDGGWRVCRAGYACLLPAHTLNAFDAIAGEPWEFCWACYQQPAEQRPISAATSPVIAKFDTQPLQSAISGLIYECRALAQPALIQNWVDLIHAYVLRFAQPTHHEDGLDPLWARVASQLDRSWTLGELAREAGYSKEHLRRLCRRQLGRSPMHQITCIRMRRAAELLTSTELTIESIAHQVGYQNAFVFSNAFNKWIGWRPSDYRRKKPKHSRLIPAGANGLAAGRDSNS
jgi:AraC-like DNA-binding protein